MLPESIDITDVEYLDSSSESQNEITPAAEINIFDEMLANLDTCNASLSQSPREKQNVTTIIKCFNNQARFLMKPNVFEW